MDEITFPEPDQNGIIRALPGELSEGNKEILKIFGKRMLFFNFFQRHFVLPFIHKANPRRHEEEIKNLISSIRNSRVLDLGCGAGGAIAHFHNSNEYTGLDLSYSMLQQAVKNAEKKSFKAFNVIEGNAEELLFKDESFDFVFMDTALHMVPEYQLTCAEIGRVLKKGGAFAGASPIVGINVKFDALWKKLSAKRPLHSLTVDDLQNVYALNGMSFTQCGANGGMMYFKAIKEG